MSGVFLKAFKWPEALRHNARYPENKTGLCEQIEIIFQAIGIRKHFHDWRNTYTTILVAMGWR